jgi:hypothetical protein
MLIVYSLYANVTEPTGGTGFTKKEAKTAHAGSTTSNTTSPELRTP